MKQRLLYLLLLTVALVTGSSGAWAAKGDQTTNVDINFDGATVNNKTITGTVGSMVWASEWTLKPYIQDNILRFGNTNGQVVSLQNNTINNKDSVTITFDLAFGKLGGKHVGFELRDKDGTAFITQWFDAYNGDFDDCNPLNLNWSSMYRGSNEPIQERCVYFTIGINYTTGKISTHTRCFMSGTGKAATEADYSADFDATKILGSFVLTGNINNAGRYSTLDNLKIVTTEGDYSTATANYTVKWDCSGTTVKELNRTGEVGSSISVSSTDKQSFEVGEKRYIYVSDNASGKTITSGNATIVTITVREANKYNYSVTSSYNNSALPFVENSWVWEDLNTITVNYPRFQAIGTQLVEKAPVNNNLTTSITITENNFATDLAYTAVSGVDNLYLLSEAENLAGTGLSTNATSFTDRVSNKLIVYGASGNLLTISDPGTYVFTLGAIGGDNSSHKVKYNVNAGNTPIISDYEVTGNFLSLKQSDEFTVSNSPVVISFTCSDPASSRGIDLVYVQRTGDAPMDKGVWFADTLVSETQSAIGDSIAITMDGGELVTDGGSQYMKFGNGGTLKLTSTKDGFGFNKIKLIASKLAGANAIWTANDVIDEVKYTFTGETKINAILVGESTLPDITAATDIAAIKNFDAGNTYLLNLEGANILAAGADSVVVEDATGGIVIKGITVKGAAKDKKLEGTLAVARLANDAYPTLVTGTHTDYTTLSIPEGAAGMSDATPTTVTTDDARSYPDNVYRLTSLKGVTIGSLLGTDKFTAVDKSGTPIIIDGRLFDGLANNEDLFDGNVLATLTGVTFPTEDGNVIAPRSDEDIVGGMLWKAEDMVNGDEPEFDLTTEDVIAKLADLKAGDVIKLEVTAAGSFGVETAAGVEIFSRTVSDPGLVDIPITADILKDVKKHGLKIKPRTLSGLSENPSGGNKQPIKAILAYLEPTVTAQADNVIWFSDANDAIARLLLGAAHFQDVREGDVITATGGNQSILIHKAGVETAMTSGEALTADLAQKLTDGILNFSQNATGLTEVTFTLGNDPRDDKAEIEENADDTYPSYKQGDKLQVNGMIMTFGGDDPEGKKYEFAEAYPEVDKFGSATEGIDQVPTDAEGKAFDKDLNNVPTKGTYYKFEPTKDGKLIVAAGMKKGNTFYFVEEGGESISEKQDADVKAASTPFIVKAGKTYYTFASDANMTFYGYTFTPTDKNAKNLAKDIATFKQLPAAAANEGDTLVLKDAVVTYIKSDHVFVEDATGAIDFYQTGIQFYVGQKLNGRIVGKNGELQYLPALFRTDDTKYGIFKVTEKITPEPAAITISEAKKKENLARFVKLEDVNLAKDSRGFKILTDGENSIHILDHFGVFYNLPNKIKYIEGIIGIDADSVFTIWPTSKNVEAADIPATFASGKYYIGNYGAAMEDAAAYWGAGNSWGTQASLVKHAEYVTLHKLADGQYQMETQVSLGGTQYFFNGDFMDNGSPITLTITRSKEPIGYADDDETEPIYGWYIANGESFFGWDGQTTVLGKGIDKSSENALWLIGSEDELKASLSDASEDDPADATFLILDPNFGRNNRNQGAWKVSEDCTNKNLSGGNNINNCAESFHSTFTISQEISDLPAGQYIVDLQGFYRQDDGETEDAPVFFANSETQEFGPMGELPDHDKSNWPSMGDASVEFTNGNYQLEPITVVVGEGETLTIGVKGTATHQWVIWDNFELTYCGPASGGTQELLRLDFETGESSDYFALNNNSKLVEPTAEGSTGRAATVVADKDRGDYVKTDVDFTDIESYVIDMDLLPRKTPKTTQFAILSLDSWNTWTHNYGLFWKTTAGQEHNAFLFNWDQGKNENTAKINVDHDGTNAVYSGVEWEFTNDTWYHLNLQVNATDGTVKYTITPKADDTEVLVTGTYQLPAGESPYIKGIYQRNGRYNYDPGAIAIDNVVISTNGMSGDEPVVPDPDQPVEPEEPTTDIAATLVHTASSSCGADAEAYTSTVDAETEHVNNDKFNAIWQGAAYMEFTISVPEDGELKKATLKFNLIGESRKARDAGLYYVNAGEVLDYTAMAAGDAKVNLAGTNIKTVTFPQNTSAEIEVDVTAAVKAMIDAGQSYIIFKVTGNQGGGDISGKASDLAPTLTLTATGTVVTGISELSNAHYEDGAIYNLRGVKVEGTLKPGLYIKNGRKVVVK